MQPILSLSTWVSLPNEVRSRIRVLFNIPRSSHTVVDDGKITTDGTTAKDFAALTVGKMQAYLVSEVSDFHKLFDLVVARVNDDIAGKAVEKIIVTPIVSNEQIMEALRTAVSGSAITIPKKRGRPSKK